ncbi:ribonuclease T2-like, partial [Blyttiomyces sp. JEL0837]
VYDDVQTRLQTYNPRFFPEISKIWVGANGDTNWFWSHEWTKHATCFSALNPSCYGSTYKKDKDVADFFGTTLNLAKTYDVYKILKDADIVPSETVTYNLTDMNAAFDWALWGNIPAFQCVKDAAGKQYVTEAWTYFYNTANLNFVPASTANKTAIGYFSSCNAALPVYYLPNLYK